MMQTRMLQKNLNLDEEVLEERFDGLMENLKRTGVSKRQVRDKACAIAGADPQEWNEAWSWMLEGDRFLVYQNAGAIASALLTDEDYNLTGTTSVEYTACTNRKLERGTYTR